MTTAEIQSEVDYRYQERLGMIAGNQAPLPEEMREARVEADAWKMGAENADRLERIQQLAKSNRRNYALAKRFGGKL